MSCNVLPARAGTYVLIIKIPAKTMVDVGKLGRKEFSRGWVLYTGSAFGPGGIRARAGRHLKHDKPLRWHIDYLTTKFPVDRVWISTSPRKLECTWAGLLTRMGGQVVMEEFGSSDCACPAHLLWFSTRPLFHTFRKGARAPVRSIIPG